MTQYQTLKEQLTLNPKPEPCRAFRSFSKLLPALSSERYAQLLVCVQAGNTTERNGKNIREHGVVLHLFDVFLLF